MSQLDEVFLEIQDNIGQLSNSAMNANMKWLDLDGLDENGEVDEEKIRAQIEAELNAAEARDRREDELYNEKKNELMKDASEREKSIYERSKKSMLNNIQDNQKDLNVCVGERGHYGDMLNNMEYAIYDGYDPNSKHNEIVRKIQQDQNLTEEEKEFIMKNHEGNMHNIE